MKLTPSRSLQKPYELHEKAKKYYFLGYLM